MHSLRAPLPLLRCAHPGVGYAVDYNSLVFLFNVSASASSQCDQVRAGRAVNRAACMRVRHRCKSAQDVCAP